MHGHTNIKHKIYKTDYAFYYYYLKYNLLPHLHFLF